MTRTRIQSHILHTQNRMENDKIITTIEYFCIFVLIIENCECNLIGENRDDDGDSQREKNGIERNSIYDTRLEMISDFVEKFA